MEQCDFASLGLSFRETIKKWDHGYEVNVSLYCTSTRDFVASFSTTTRTSDGKQILNTSSQFVQHDYLAVGQITAITGWLRKCAIQARWRLTTFTTLIEVCS